MINYICETCGGEDIRVNADVTWSKELQRWIVVEIFFEQDNGAMCESCGDERHIGVYSYGDTGVVSPAF